MREWKEKGMRRKQRKWTESSSHVKTNVFIQKVRAPPIPTLRRTDVEAAAGAGSRIDGRMPPEAALSRHRRYGTAAGLTFCPV